MYSTGETGTLIRRICYDPLGAVVNLKFSPDGRFLAAAMVGAKEWFSQSSTAPMIGTKPSEMTRMKVTGFPLRVTDVSRQHPSMPKYGFTNTTPTIFSVDLSHNGRSGPRSFTGGLRPYHIAFSPDGSRLAVGFLDRIAVDVLDGATLQHLGSHSPMGLRVPSAEAGLFEIPLGGLSKVAWSLDGLILFATGAVVDGEGHSIVLAWDRSGLGDERRLPDCGDDTAADVTGLPSGRVFVASMEPCLGLLNAGGATIWSARSRIMRLFGPPGQIIRGFQDDRL